jgi:putative redox protein
MSDLVTRVYENDKIAVVWKAGLCTHCQNCINGLPEVFDLSARPWVNINGSTPEKIAAQVADCPSGALTLNN